MILKKFTARRPVIKRQYKSLNMVAKSPSAVTALRNKNSVLRNAMNSLFTTKNVKRLAKGGTLAGLVAFGATSVADYIHANSGCFRTSRDGRTTCKVADSSCCQPEPVDGVDFCPVEPKPNVCHGFDEDKAGSCCLLCDCDTHGCDDGETMTCVRPTVGEALSFFSKELVSGAWSGLTALFPWLVTLGTILGALLVLWLARFAYTFWQSRG